MGVKALVLAQEEIAVHISRALSNYKKSKNKLTRAYVEARLELLETNFMTFKTTHLEILKGATSDERKTLSYYTEDKYYNCEDEYLELKTLMKEFLHDISSRSVPVIQSKENVPSTTALMTKLPAITIPSFSGDYNDWPSFFDLFKSLIHTNESLSKIQKYHYLKSNLKGDAEILLRQFPLTEANYNKALEVLESRYNNKRLIVHAHVTQLLNQKRLPSESAKGIRELLDTTNECLHALNNIGVSTNNWDPLVTHLIVAKFDNESHRLWEQKLGGTREIPTIKDLLEFMEIRFRSLEALNLSNPSSSRLRPQHLKTFKTEYEPVCSYCSQDHYIYNCKEFGKLSSEQRRDVVKEKRLCFNCLIPNHSVKVCRQSTTCKICKRRHHSLLHSGSKESNTMSVAQVEVCDVENEEDMSQVAVHRTETSGNQVLLATALVRITAKNGKKHTLRALVDQGSQASFITTSVAQRLGLQMSHAYSKVTGVDPNMTAVSKATVNFGLYSMHTDEVVTQVNAHVLKTLVSILPRKKLDIDISLHFKGLSLADPTFNKPSGIELLLGAEVHAEILLDGLQKYGLVIAQKSRLGWLLSGKVSNDDTQHNDVMMHSQLETDDLLQRFWESEELFTTKRTLTASEIQCDKIFDETHYRTSSGRYVVALPFSYENETTLGESRQLAVKRLLQMERKFTKDLKFHERYKGFMEEYETLNHMEKVPKEELRKPDVCYLPHHGVVREESTTTKLRVVFDGSAETSTGTSLNQQLLIGPSLQHDIRDLFLRWRAHKICIIADIQRMYRQILVRKADMDYQRIVWRNSRELPIADYRLCTVTYGTSCAPYLAIKTLRQLACDERDKFPKAAMVLESDFYTDDLMSGCDTENDAIELCNELKKLLLSGGFVLHKWGSNSVKVLESLPTEDNKAQKSRNIVMENSIKTLGIKWNPKIDCFELNIQFSEINAKVTKRNVLSDVAKIYDPLGWLSPVVIVAKVFLQKLWLLGHSWDDEIPDKYKSEWLTFRSELHSMATILFPRWIGMTKSNKRIEIHGFSDASNTAYAGVIYIRILDEESGVIVKLIAAKTKVAPVKQISIPRLELCGAVLTAKLINRVKSCLKVPDENVFCWTDSTTDIYLNRRRECMYFACRN